MALSNAEKKAINILSKLEKDCQTCSLYLQNNPVLNPVVYQQILLRKDALTSLFDKVNTSLESLDIDSTVTQESDTKLSKYFEVISSINVTIEQYKIENSSPSIHSESSNSLHNPNVNFRLPEIKLPSFSGSALSWASFRDTFQGLILEANLSEANKFHYLNACLAGEAKELLSNLPRSGDNFSVAWELLKNRYDSPRILVSSHLNSLLQPPILKENCPNSLRKLIDHYRLHTNALRSIQTDVDLSDLILVALASKSLPADIIKQWEISLSSDELPDFNALLNYLEIHQRSLRAVCNLSSNPSNKGTSKGNSSAPKDSGKPPSKGKCPKCSSEHPIKDCPSFLKLTPKDRHSFIVNCGRCIRCFRVKDSSHSCTFKCPICNKSHHKLLHFGSVNAQTPSAEVNVTSSSLRVGTSLLPTAMVNCVARNNKFEQFLSLLDSGSNANLITWKAVKSLKLRTTRFVSVISSVTSDSINSSHCAKVRIHSSDPSFTWSTEIDCIVVNHIPKALNSDVNSSNWQLPVDLFYANPDFNISKDVDLLLGAGVMFEILLPNRLTRPDGNFPVVQQTALGWVVAGKTPLCSSSKAICNYVHTGDLCRQIKNFWEVEEVVPLNPIPTSEEIAEHHFVQTHTRDEHGRYVVRLPTNDKLHSLGQTRFQALNRFHSFEKRLSRNPELKAECQSFMKEYLSLGHMQPAVPQNDKGVQYIPYHCVFKQSSETSKIRIVFDASCRSTTGVSVNDVLYNGPKIQDDLFDTLLRFRLHHIAIVSDLEKMFRQIRVNQADQYLQHVLWRENENLPVQDYALTTVTYGFKPATFLAVRTLHQLADDEGTTFQLGAHALKTNFYVDDFLFSCNNLDTAKTTISELNAILDKGGFKLRKWASNSRETLSHLSHDSLASTNMKSFMLKEGDVSTLGLCWDTTTDNLSLSVPDKLNVTLPKCTKRLILSIISSLFDPLGLLAPVIITYKLIFQKTWSYNLSWDDPIPADLQTEWLELYQSLGDISSVLIDRCILPKGCSDISLHGFSDSSIKAYGAAIYFRFLTESGEPMAKLVCAKSKVAPTNSKTKENAILTVPRLELCAAVLLLKLVSRVLSIFSSQLVFHDITCWTDSKIVLDWIKNPPSKGNIFARNRAQYIRESNIKVTWRYVNTEQNPADLLTRGVKPSLLKVSDIWWTGPEFLRSDPVCWPSESVVKVTPPPLVLSTRVTSVNYLNDRICSYYGSYHKIIRVMAYVLRFINILKHSIANKSNSQPNDFEVGPLTVSEINSAELQCIKIVQQVAFPQVFNALLNKTDCPADNSLKALQPFICSDKCLRVGGRISQSNLPYDTLHPLILPHSNHLTNTLILNTHVKQQHTGVQNLTTFLRQRFWITSIRRAIKSAIRSCVICFRHRPIPAEQIMAELPAVRVNPNPAFNCVGIDYTGHFYIKFGIRGKARAKAYLALFICMVTKAVHVEIVSDLTTEAFLMALKRFIYRRGPPSAIYSDNACNFVGAHERLSALYNLLKSKEFQNTMIDHCAVQRIKWHFIAPRSPHMGGIWEAGIKLLKRHLIKEIGDTPLTYEELLTLSLQAENILNSRPLIRPSDDVSDFDYLTPGHFLIGRPLNSISAPIDNKPKPLKDHWQCFQQFVMSVWKRWSREYLVTLQRRAKWITTSPNIKVNTPVLLIEDNLPPLSWRLGLITRLYPGRDGKVRTVDVKTTTGVFIRHINRLCPLPIEHISS